MEIYKAPDNSLHCLDDGVDPVFVPGFPVDCVKISADEAEAICKDKNVKTPTQLKDEFTAAIQKRLDDFAGTRNYDSILSACTYATDPNPKFTAEGQYCVNKRSETWAAAYNILAQVQAGTRPMPSSIADIEADLPPLVWPA